MLCQSCDCLYINGHKCHERGCPDAWRDEIRECAFCGSEFTPYERHERFCSTSCYCAYNGYPDEEED